MYKFLRPTALGGVALSVAAATALIASGVANAQTIKLETYAGPKHSMNTTAWPTWVKWVEKESGGELKVRTTYPPINPRDLLDRVRKGIADVAWITHGYTTGRFAFTDMVELPGLNGNAEQMSRAYWRVYNKHPVALKEHKGVVLLALFTHGPGMLHTRKPVESISAVNGLKVRTGGGMQAAIAKRLNIVTVSAPVTKAHEILSRGVADGIFFSIETITSFRLGDTVKYHYAYPGGLYTASFAAIMNKRTFDKLSKANQAALMRASGERMSAMIGSVWDGADKAAVKSLGAKGNVVTSFNAKTAGEIRGRLAGLDAEWFDRAKAAGMKNPEGVLQDLRNEVKKIKSK
jgi:TRAP-type C4-dicarboxylate transport system substrate-binding protein